MNSTTDGIVEPGLMAHTTLPMFPTSSRPFMGQLLVNAGRLSPENVERIIAFQQEKSMRFGEVGRALGFLTEGDVRFALSLQYQYVKSLGIADEWLQRWSRLLDKIERVHTFAEKRQLLERLGHPVRPFVLAFANAHAMNSLAVSDCFFKALCAADMVLRDGSGMATLFKFLKIPPGLNLNGTDLIPELLWQFNGRNIALFGTQSPYLERGMQVASHEFAPQSRYISENGFLDVAAYLALAATHQPALIVLGMGMPRQEEVASALRSELKFPCLIVCGGAIIDFLGGKTSRAPSWLRSIGMEWVFRLGTEPRRLFRRYVIGNPLFLTRALRLASLNRRLERHAP
ncbi:WecB/TagA/CpsF family glycosyltransferase [Polaromonas sp.]|uniref:WecB/TagA/CpsF family glycosyltransferase n=1 Tax=Polaromonas sp. TaxID=1869339 RepID=UPI003BB64BD5